MQRNKGSGVSAQVQEPFIIIAIANWILRVGEFPGKGLWSLICLILALQLIVYSPYKVTEYLLVSVVLSTQTSSDLLFECYLTAPAEYWIQL